MGKIFILSGKRKERKIKITADFNFKSQSVLHPDRCEICPLYVIHSLRYSEQHQYCAMELLVDLTPSSPTLKTEC